MPLLGAGVLAIWNSISPEGEDDFYRWHNTEHIPERVAVPGFLRGRRYLSTTRPHDYFTLYETESVETIRSGPYLARLNDPTPWTRRVLPHFRDTARIGCRVAASWGRGQGGGLLALRWHPSGPPDGVRAWAETDLSVVRQLTGIVGVHVLEPVPETTAIQTVEKQIRGVQPGEADARPPWILLVEANDPEAADALARGPLARIASGPGALVSGYRLQFSLLARE
jgi:hypothetical protein